MKTVAIIQARMASTRLPGKILIDLAGRPLLHHVVARAGQAKTLDQVIVATTDSATDDETAQYCRQVSIPCFRGSEDDVLDRYYQSAKRFEADVVVRLTADCPLQDPEVIDKVVRVFNTGDYDYVSNTIDPTYPDGLDTEVFSRLALERAWQEAALKSEREHVTPYIWKHPTLFRLANVRNDIDLSKLRWTVDERQDLEFVRAVYVHLAHTPAFGMKQLLDLLDKHPELTEINAHFGRNEGYEKSLRADALAEERGAQ